MKRPAEDEYVPYFKTYIDKVEGEDVLSLMKKVHADTQQLLQTIPVDQEDFAYAEGKWTIKELILHLCDCERVFQYRAVSFARGDETGLPGFDHDNWVVNSNAAKRSLSEIANEYRTIRNASISLFESFDEEQLSQSGLANGNKVTVRALAFILVGHELHHRNVLQERYIAPVA